MLSPIPASIGSILVVWPGAGEQTLTVMLSDGETVVSTADCPEGRLYGELLNLFLDGVIRPLTIEDERSLLRVA